MARSRRRRRRWQPGPGDREPRHQRPSRRLGAPPSLIAGDPAFDARGSGRAAVAPRCTRLRVLLGCSIRECSATCPPPFRALDLAAASSFSLAFSLLLVARRLFASAATPATSAPPSRRTRPTCSGSTTGASPSTSTPTSCRTRPAARWSGTCSPGSRRSTPRTSSRCPTSRGAGTSPTTARATPSTCASRPGRTGQPLTARDFEWSWKRLLDPKTASKYGSMLYVLQNGAPFNQGALWVRGIEWQAGEEDATAERIAALFEEAVPVDRVELTDWPERGAFVYLAGEADRPTRPSPEGVEPSRRSTGGRWTRLRGGKLRCRSPTARSSACARSTTSRSRRGWRARCRTSRRLLTHYALLPVPRHVIERLEREGHRHRALDPARAHRLERRVRAQGPPLPVLLRVREEPALLGRRLGQGEQDPRPLVESYNTALNLYRAGEFDWIGRNTSLPSEFMNYLEGFDDFSRDPYGSVYFYLDQHQVAAARQPEAAPRACRSRSTGSRSSTTSRAATRRRPPTWCPTASPATRAWARRSSIPRRRARC